LLPARVLWALACAAEQDDEGMLWGISAAMVQSEAEGALLAFMEEGRRAITLLRRVAAIERPDATGRRDTAARLLDALVAAYAQGRPRDGRATEGGRAPESLTPRELEVLALMAAGATNAEIAARLVVTVGTVKAHSRSLFGKLGVANRTEAAARAHQLGLLAPGAVVVCSLQTS
jgi:LuxR family maltose regulon positive regulatory protein